MITSDLMKITLNQGSSCGDSSRVNVSIDDSVSDVGNTVSSVESDESVSNCITSPGGRNYYVPVCSSEILKPSRNQIFESLEKGIAYYREYGRLSGFDIRRTTETKDELGVTIIRKYMVCSKEGFNEKISSVPVESSNKCVQQRRSVSRRCGCKAKCVFTFISGNRYVVSRFVEVHNHPLASGQSIQFLRASRQMGISTRQFVVDAAKVNIGTSKAYSLLKEMVGGYANVGATAREFRNFNRDLKCFVGERDGQMLIDKFTVMHETCESFYFAYELDSEGHLTKIFWADPIGRRNYDLYGDAVSFDATFDTNRYNMIFAPFTGVDKHYRCVTFAACLLSKEDIPHFTWAFNHFLKAMGRNPVVMVTDQCPAMKVAIPDVFKKTNDFEATKHRLCMWHIMEKFPIKLGNNLCKETDFMEKMKSFIWSSNIEPNEFEKGWTSVLKEFKLEGNKWLNKLYSIRGSWIPAFFRDKPMFGLMRTTSRSESENHFFSQFHKQGDTLCEFWLRFESAMEKQRNETARLSHESNSSLPTTISRWFIEDNAAELFTRTIFYILQEEIVSSCLDMQIKRMSEEVDGVTSFEIKDVNVKDKIFKVSVSFDHAVCSCNKFVMCGILCRHGFCGLKQIGVVKFPKSLVLNRWMKIAESGSASIQFGVSEDFFKMQKVALKRTNIWFDFRQVVSKAGTQIDKLNHVHETIKQLSNDLGDDASNLTTYSKADHMASVVGQQPTKEISVLAPVMCKNKGSGLKRFISQREKAINKANKRIRKCKLCFSTKHDSRTCPKKNDVAGEATKNTHAAGEATMKTNLTGDLES